MPLKTIFTPKHNGRSVVYKRDDGSTQSAKIESVASEGSCLILQWPISPTRLKHQVVLRKDWDRLTLFPVDSFFMVTQ
jgi:hypothetical protein